MPPLTITGYVREIGEVDEVIIDGCAWATWSRLGSEYWRPGVRRRVSKDRVSCTVKMGARAECFKDGVCQLVDLSGCYVEIRAKVQKYAFHADGAEITGWTLRGDRIKKIDIPIGYAHTRSIDGIE